MHLKKQSLLPDFIDCFGKGSLLPMGRGMLDHVVTLSLVVQGTMCRDMW